jgi:hypothetical protein
MRKPGGHCRQEESTEGMSEHFLLQEQLRNGKMGQLALSGNELSPGVSSYWMLAGDGTRAGKVGTSNP